ncbi:YggS family pyridoxal phosphate-dependent enzyme [Gordonia tangerina]|uniref:Pyridoxal phosphate homeostasis protein n=1 Tax=Gordonia tangerina TaxID=2911060 RepID=A0ABS9DGW4_9ACTN|nr:YggS family pyridoxal phosphate-dependent enzyme [Gordonia tangerina]MCF3938470.1 YggS family pyridoxal phosphate-dependent enzyme [Gordonia tangerina]
MTPPESDARRAELARGYTAVRERLDAAVAAAGRSPGDVQLLVVTKFFPAADVRHLIGLGVRTFGESREPEAGRKIAELRQADATDAAVAAAEFDMIGSVQSKKAKSVARWARTVHSVDRAKVVDALSSGVQEACDTGSRSADLGILLQVSLDGDPHRGGVTVEELPELAEHVRGAHGLTLQGLMVIAPVDGAAQRWMARAQEIHAAFVSDHPDARELSAGMSGDLEEAVAHGSTCVRVGTAIMGPRPLVSQ